ncbi:3'(2'),5'-bisphosphate nucleotidase CysQ [Microvirga sp. W0021]|uniref:3'(2'),5'-bisphosphate nucleotidase CysQ n=1 Tax=Hohaiivirga grylli TaxID=3133970 RepID=A0ABV0BH52_9HYPH
MTISSSFDQISKELAPIAQQAGQLLMQIQQQPQNTHKKDDGTPTCQADTAAEAVIIDALRQRFPDIPIISEERVRDTNIRSLFFLVDPLDGTADFIDGGTEFCVNIALIENGRPVASVIHAPCLEKTWLAGETVCEVWGKTTEPHHIATRIALPERFTALTSNRYGDETTERFLNKFPLAERQRISSAIKFCLIAEGAADIYVRYGRTMEWDTAAGDLILTKAGGQVMKADGTPLLYGKAESNYANPGFIAIGDRALAQDILPELTTRI